MVVDQVDVVVAGEEVLWFVPWSDELPMSGGDGGAREKWMNLSPAIAKSLVARIVLGTNPSLGAW